MSKRQHAVATDAQDRIGAIPFERSELEQSIVGRFEKVAALCAPQTALRGNGEEWTYDELDRRSNQVARAILDRTPPGAGCVAYLVDHSPNMVICALGALKAAKAYLCLHPHLPATALRDVIRDAAPDSLLTDASHETIARSLCGDERPVILVEEIGLPYSLAPLGLRIDPSDPAVIFYTSGSTGRAKGVVKSHRALLHRAWLCARYDSVNTTDRQSLLTYCSFASSEADCFGALLNGAALELFDVASRGFAGLRDWIDEQQITLLHPPVALFRRYLAKLEGAGLHPSVRLVALAGETVTASDLALWRHHFARSCALRHRFSSTEAGHIAVACIQPFASLTSGEVPLARPVEDKFLSIIDEAGRTVEEGGIGELVVRSAFLADGYWRRDQDSAEHFRIDAQNPNERLFRTGDIVRLVDNKGLEFLGRRDTQVKISGYRVEMPEIEHALLSLPGVKEAAVIAEPRLGANALISFVVMREGESFRPDALRSALRSVLPKWKVPAYIYPLEALPLTLTGKIDRRLLHQHSRRAIDQ